VATIGGVGQLPDLTPIPSNRDDQRSADANGSTSSTLPPPPTTAVSVENTVGAKAAGNRILMIGDSVLAGTSKRYTNDMCEAIVPLGWQVDLEAETGRFIDFGQRVLNKKWPLGWDAVFILLGNNYNGDINDFATRLNAMIDVADSVPVLLATVSEFEKSRAEVNNAIREIAYERPNVQLLEWSDISAFFADSILSGDGIHPTDAGRVALARNVAASLGRAPDAEPGECLRTDFNDDSSGPVRGSSTTSPSSNRSSTPSTKPRSVTTRPSTQTTVSRVTTTRPTTTTRAVTATTTRSTPTTTPTPPSTERSIGTSSG